MTFRQNSKGSHSHRYFVDANTGDQVCLCGVFADATCKQCKRPFSTKQNNGGKKIYCSHRCANIGTGDQRSKTFEKKREKNQKIKICPLCKKEYIKNRSFSMYQWQISKFCSSRCAREVKKIKDGMTNGERYRRRKGQAKKHTEEWLEKIKARTKEAMYRPEIQAKIRQSRSALSIKHRIKI